MARRLDLDRRLAPYAPLRFSGRLRGAPTLCLDDFSAIPFLEVPGAEEYQHRARLRADDGDLYAAVSLPSAGYESYCRDFLGLGTVELVRARANVGHKEVARACRHEPALGRLVARAREAGALVLHPYMGIETVWALAARLREAAGVPVEVLAPPPPVTWIANDKSLMSDLVAGLLGSEWLVETRSSVDPEGLARHLLELATRHEQVALKRLRCASATGNKVYPASRLAELSAQDVEREVRAFLALTEWDEKESVLAVAWERSLASPSTQVWIPPPHGGAPKLEGVYEQILSGEEGLFVGSRPSTLPVRVNRLLGDAAIVVAAGLQKLGYVGRCSFDHLVLGDPEGDCRLRFTECNGRWGGTSIPMHLVDRLTGAREHGDWGVGNSRRPFYRAQDVMSESLRGVPFAEILDAVRPSLFDPRSRRGHFVLYNPGPLALVGKIDVIALGETQEEAEEAMESELPRLLGL